MNNITTLKPKEGVELLAIVVDKDAYDFKMSNDIGRPYLSYFIKHDTSRRYLPDGDYSILGEVEYNKPIEFDCDELVYGMFGMFMEYPIDLERQWNNKSDLTSEQSFISFLDYNNLNLKQLEKENKKLVILTKQ